ncbi:alpha-glucosidase C-terminal domain-containing protein [bacterium]|nr:alpha-glucosidase C-terminal domain-containing protein [bacterium]
MNPSPLIPSRLHTRWALLLLVMLAIPGPVAFAGGQDVADEVFYHYMPICWRDSDGDAYRFGDFGGMTAALPYLTELGVTAIWMNPVFPSPAYHGYQHGRADQLNPWFGTEADFIAFIEAAHAAGIKVFVDFVAYGISHDSPWYQDAYGHPGSVYDDWLAFTNPANTESWGSTFNTWNGATVGHVWWDLRDPGPVGLVTQWAQHWLDPDGDGDFGDGLDGYRLDHVWKTYPNGTEGWGYHIDTFWAPWRNALRTVNPDVFVFAEQADWGSQGIELLAGLDAAFTKPFEFAARDALRWEFASALYDGMAAANAALGGSPHPGTLMTTIGNHDVDRLATSIGDGFAKGKAAAAVLLTQPFTPVIYHGDEIGMRGAKNTSYSGDAADIPMREPFKWNAVVGPPMSDYDVLNAAAYAGRIAQDNDGRSVEEQLNVPGSLLEAYRQLIAVRKGSVALRRGGYHPVAASDGGVWAFARAHDDQQVLVVINVTGGARSFRLDLGGFAIPGGSTQPVDLLGGPAPAPLTDVNKGSYPLSFGAYGYAVYDLDVVPPAPPAVIVDGRSVPGDFFPHPALATQDSPTHLGDNVSELDQMFARISGDSLFVGITGNLGTDGTGLALLIDAAPGGQTTLDTSTLSPPPSGPQHLTGLRLDPGFEPETLLFVNAYSGTIYTDRVELPSGSGAVKSYVGQGIVGSGNGLLTGGSNPGGIRVALDNSNTSGVTGSSAADAGAAVTGFELFLSLADLGHAGGPVRLAAFILETSGDVSNQWLPPLGGVTGSLGIAPDLTAFPESQFAELDGASGVGLPAVDGLEASAQATGEGAVFRFTLVESGPVTLAIHDLRGREVCRLLDGIIRPAGQRSAFWDGRSGGGRPVASGVYLFRLEAGGMIATGRVVLVR